MSETMEPIRDSGSDRCKRCDAIAVGWAYGVPLCEAHWYEKASAESEAERERWQEERRERENAEMDRHFTEHPHG